MKFLLPFFLALVGLGSGIGAGLYLGESGKDPATGVAEGVADDSHSTAQKSDHASESTGAAESGHGTAPDHESQASLDYIKLNNQFVVPLIEDGDVKSLVVLALSLEVTPGQEEFVYSHEPKLRDALLRVLFDHANAGGFSREFTRTANMMVLRDSLLEIARRTLGNIVQNVLIVELVRQDT